MSDPVVHITLDPPYRLTGDDAEKILIGWCEVDDEAAPDIEVTINGLLTLTIPRRRPDVNRFFPALKVGGVRVEIDFRTLLKDADRMQDRGGFLLEACVRSGRRRRTFEYAVTSEWLAKVFGEGLRAYPVPPPHLQIRVAGAAVGAFVASGRRVGEQIEGLMAAHASGFPRAGRVHDFGCGPGRVVHNMALKHRDAVFSGSDIDAEAVAWCHAEIGSVGRFFTNDAWPPLALADGELDLAYGVSVFTHLPEDMQHAWMAELRRVIRPGGHLVTTKLDPFAYPVTDDVATAAREAGYAYFAEETSVDGLPEFYRLAYHTDDYVRATWGRYFEVLHIGSHDLNDTQDAVVLRRPA